MSIIIPAQQDHHTVFQAPPGSLNAPIHPPENRAPLWKFVCKRFVAHMQTLGKSQQRTTLGGVLYWNFIQWDEDLVPSSHAQNTAHHNPAKNTCLLNVRIIVLKLGTCIIQKLS